MLLPLEGVAMEKGPRWETVTGLLDMWARDVNFGNVALSFRVQKSLFSSRSPFQQIDVVQTADHGRLLINDGIFMLTERDEFIYHEMIAHVPLCVHPSAKRVLVIGGGDGGTVREVLKHRGVERTVLVEIDEMVVKACREHIPSVSAALDDPRLEIRYADGVRYVAETDERFDLAIVDSTDPVGPGAVLYEAAFYRNVARVLSDDGIMITQAETPLYYLDAQKTIFGNQRPFFKRLHMYLYPIITYTGALYSFGWASKRYCPLADFTPQRAESAELDTRYYNAGIHRAAFMLPNFVRTAFEGLLDPVNW